MKTLYDDEILEMIKLEIFEHFIFVVHNFRTT